MLDARTTTGPGSPAAAAARGPTGGGPRRGRVLVVAADAGLRRFVAEALADDGYEAQTAAGAAAGLVAAAGAPPALVLLDLRPAGPAGPPFGAWYRRQPGPRAPVVLLSAVGVAETVAAVAATGAAGFLRLPCELDALLALAARLARPPALTRA